MGEIVIGYLLLVTRTRSRSIVRRRRQVTSNQLQVTTFGRKPGRFTLYRFAHRAHNPEVQEIESFFVGQRGHKPRNGDIHTASRAIEKLRARGVVELILNDDFDKSVLTSAFTIELMQKGYRIGSVFNKTINAETVERAVIDAVKAMLLDTENLRDKLRLMLAAEAHATAVVDVDELRRQHGRLKKRTEFIVANFDEESVADAQSEVEKLKAHRRSLDEQIAAAAASTEKIQQSTKMLRLTV